MTVAKEISKYELDLVGVRKVRWDRDGTEPAHKYTFSYRNGNENLSRHQNAGQNHDIKIGNRCFNMWHSSDIWERL
jgi:hypothetical protein